MSSEETIEGRLSVLDDLLQRSLECDDDNIITCLVARDGLLDALLALYDECCHTKLMNNKHVAAFVNKYSSTVSEIRRLRIQPSDFEVKDVIGRGHFGEVQVVRDRHTETVYAMKTLRKQETLAQSEISFYEEERDIMASATSPWLTKLHFAFQDAQTLYLIMEFHAGGDLLSLLSRHDDIFEEKMARFYLAEIVLATHDLHEMGYVHRDLKPENVLLDCIGHVKLADFGSAAKLSRDGQVSSKMPVGTPDYVCPELLNAMNSEEKVNNYGQEVDWWSLGVCMYEMLYGRTPFTDESGSMVATYSNIMNYKSCLKFPTSAVISPNAKSLITSLLIEKEKRLGYHGIQGHTFFTEVKWNNMRKETPPFVPQLQGLDDTSNFEEFEKIRHPHTFDDPKSERDFTGKDLPFVGFTYMKKQSANGKRPKINIEVDAGEVKSAKSSRQSIASVDVTVNLKIAELKRLREKCNLLEDSECSLKSQLATLKMKCEDKEEEIAKVNRDHQLCKDDLDTYISKTNRLSKQLEAMLEERVTMENKVETMYAEMNNMSSEAREINEELLQLQIADSKDSVCQLEDVISQLETEKHGLLRKVSQRDQQLQTYRDQLETSQKHAQKLQFKIDKDRRKSRDDQKRDLVQLENREDVWRSEVEDKNAEIIELNKRVAELTDLMEAYETHEKEAMEREAQLRGEIKEHTNRDIRDNLDIRVLVQTSTPSPKKARKMSEKFKEMEFRIEKQDTEKQTWETKEEEMKNLIEKLKDDLDSEKQGQKVTSEVKASLTEQVRMYQQEIHEQRDRIKELQESVKLCLSESDDDKTRKQNRMEKKVKELEEQLDSYRDDKRRLLADVSKYQVENNDKQYKITELDRTTSRQSCKIERLERQLNEAREKEIDLRLRRNQTSDIRIKLAEDRVVDIELEKAKLETKISDLSKEVNEMKSKQMDSDNKAHSKTAKILSENLELKSKQEEVNRTVEKFEKQITKCERNIANLEEDIATKNKEIQTLRVVKTEKSSLERKVQDLEMDIKSKEIKLKAAVEKEKQVVQLEREKENLETKVNLLEKDLNETKSKEKTTLTKQAFKLEDVENLRQEKRYLESRVNTLQRQLEAADKKVAEADKKLTENTVNTDKVKALDREISSIKHEKTRLQDELKDVKCEQERKLKSQADQRRDVNVAEDKLDKERGRYDEMLTKVRSELNESNLALSEARSLLSATQRQEKQTRESLESDIRELNQRIFKLEKERGLHEDQWNNENAHKIKKASDFEKEIEILKSQNDSLKRKQKEVDEKSSASQREKTASLMEKQLLKDGMAQKEHQCQLEAQKVEKLRGICTELENQIKDLEALTVDHEAKETEWKEARHMYERAMEERESELEGTTSRLHALKQARQSSHDMATNVKTQLQQAKDKYKRDLDKLNKQVTEMMRHTQKEQLQIGDLESKNSKFQMIVEQQTILLENDQEEKRRLKEEISNILTENQEVKRKSIKLRQNLEEAIDKLEIIFGEKIDLENFTEALQGLHFLEKYRFESTIDQQMKLIDYLQVLWQDNVNKKKKGGKFFGKNKDGTVAMPIVGDLHLALDAECKRSKQLQEQLDRLRSENFTQANELLKVKGILRENTAHNGNKKTITNSTITAAVEVCITPLPASHPSKSISGPPLLTPSTKRSTRMLVQPAIVPTPQRMQHKIPHRFVNGLNTRATKCAVCLGSVHFVKQAAKCQECSMVCHPKCVVSVPATCGLPTEYVSHFSNMMDKGVEPIFKGQMSPQGEQEVIKMKGWVKIRKIGKQPGWERRYCMMEGNILMVFMNDTDANPVDTFDLNPPETDVTVHSAVSTAELPSTATTDLPYVLRLEHEPLTTCWPGRVLYLMTRDFTEKQRWVACLEAAIKNLQRVDKTKRYKLQVTSLLELSGNERLELNCSLLLSKQLTLLGADEGLYAINVYREPPVLTKLNKFDSVHQLKFVPQLSLIVMVTGKNREVITIDKKLIQLRLGQSNGEETQQVPHTVVKEIVGCTVLDVGCWADAVYMCVGMTEKIIIMKYNPDLRLFCVRKELSICEPCSCISMADNFAIVGTDRFYQINLDHPSLTEFVDKKDNSLAFAAFGAVTHNSYPLAVVQVSPEGLPLEFLICFHEFGVYVDSKGRRSRPKDMKWSCLPLSFAYREPFLFVTYFNSVQAITVPACKDEIRGKQTSIDRTCPRFLGSALEPGSVYVACSSSGVTTELLNLRGNDGTIIEPMGKENKKGVKPSVSASKYGSQRYVSPKKTNSYNPAKYKSSNRCRRLSLTSIDSNSSVSSSSTVSSYHSVQSDC